MKITRNTIIQSLISTFLAVLFIACGGKNLTSIVTTPIVNAATHARVFLKPQPGTGIGHNSSGVSTAALFFATATAPTPSATPQSFNGFCSVLPPSGTLFEPYGLGTFGTSDCTQFWTSAPIQGPPVVDDGTLRDLVVTSQTPSTDPAGATFTVYIGTAGTQQSVATPITCTILTGQSVCKDKATSTNHTAAVLDGAWVGVVGSNANGLSNVQVVFGKE